MLLAIVFVVGLGTGVAATIGYTGKQAADATVTTFEEVLEGPLEDLRAVATGFYPNVLALWVAYYHYSSSSMGAFADVAEDVVAVLAAMGTDALAAAAGGSLTLDDSIRAMDDVIRDKPKEVTVPWAAVKASLDAARRLQQLYFGEQGDVAHLVDARERALREAWWRHFWQEMGGEARESRTTIASDPRRNAR